MAGMKFEYDESGYKFVYFLISFYAMIIIPATYYLWPRKETKKLEHAEDLSCFEPCRLKNQLLNKDQPRKKLMRKIIMVILAIGWVIFFFLAYKASQIEIEHKEYDPFAILGLDRSASEKEIKKQYRELSKTMHPDKGGDEEKFKQLAKAYQALTDEETRRNWQEYGNPDGPGVTQFGIALPKWIVEGKNSYLVLGVYVLIFMILLPIFVGSWWYKSIKYTGDQVLLTTSQLYGYLFMKNSLVTFKKAIMILASSREFERGSNQEIEERPSDNTEVPKLIKELPEFQEKIKERPYSDPYSIKARALICAHLNRIDLPPQTLEKDKNTIVAKCPFLINEMINTATNLIAAVNANYLPKLNCPKLETIECLMKLSPLIVQALWYKTKNNLLQLPHLEESHLRHFVTKKRKILNIKEFVTMNDSDRRSVLRHLTDEQYDDIMRVCSYYPLVDMDVKVKIIDDEDEHTITAGALTTLIVTLNRTNLSTLIGQEDSATSKVEQLNSIEGFEEGEDGSAADASGKDNKTSTHKPWEKQQKKKPKYLGNKPKPKAAAANSKAAAKKSPTGGKTAAADTKEEDKSPSKEDNDEEKDENKEEAAAGSEGDESEVSDVSESEDNAERAEEQTSRSSSKPSPRSTTTTTATTSNNSGERDDEYFEKFQLMQKKKEKLETKKKVSHRVYCPYFPQIKQECWWLYVSDRKQNSLICSPVYICTLKDTEEIELKFLAPKTPGHYTYTVILRSDSYVDFDIFHNLKLEVQPAQKVEEHPQWNFTDEEAAEDGDKPDQDDEFTTESESD